jgi:hypothetical protein
MKINEILELNCIKVPLNGTTKEEIISELVAMWSGKKKGCVNSFTGVILLIS